jgi:Tfp pilus assembly protein PilW
MNAAFATMKAGPGRRCASGIPRHEGAFTLAEVMVGLAGSVIVIGALLFGAFGLQRSLHASELYANYQANQRRILDYLSRDLRRSIGIGSATSVSGSGATKLVSGSVAVENQTALVLTLPGYYQGNEPGVGNYDQPLPVMAVASKDQVGYGTTSGLAPGVTVIFRKEYLASEGCVCYVRQEAAANLIIVRHAENINLQVTVTNGSSCLVQVSFQSPYSGVAPLVTTSDNVMLRNIRTF